MQNNRSVRSSCGESRMLLGSPHQENEQLGSVYLASDNKRLARTCDVIRCRRSSRRRTRPQPCHSCIAACSYTVEQEPFRLIWRNRFSLVLDSATEHIFPLYVASRDARIALLTNFWSFFGLVSPYFSYVRVDGYAFLKAYVASRDTMRRCWKAAM